MDEISETLGELGLSSMEIRVYLAALQLGTANAADIAQHANIQRTYFYDLSKKLMAGGFLKQGAKGGKSIFHAADPDEVLAMYRNRFDRLQSALPRLQAIHNTKNDRPRIYFYEGREGIEHINKDTLVHEGEIVGFTTPLFVTKELEKFIQARKKSGNPARVIGEMSSELLELKRRDKEDMRETRILPKEVFSSSVEIGIYANKVYMVDYRQEFGFIIEGQEFAKSMKQIFDLIWNGGRIMSTPE